MDANSLGIMIFAGIGAYTVGVVLGVLAIKYFMKILDIK